MSKQEKTKKDKAVVVNVENFRRVETNRMFFGIVQRNGGVNRWHYDRQPFDLGQQKVIRMNRDTLYNDVIADISNGAILTIPDPGERYMSVGIYNQDNYVNRVFHKAGTYELTMDEFDTPYVLVLARILVDASNPEDVAAVNALQDGFALSANSSEPFIIPNYDPDSYQRTYDALLELGRGLTDLTGMGGSKEQVDPARHLIGTAMAWGGLPTEEVVYANVDPGFPVGEFRIIVPPVPVDGFWSITVYNKDGFLEKNDRDAYNINNINGIPNDDGSITVHFGGCEDNRPNCLPITEGWNYGVRMYRPRPEILDGTWTFPAVEQL